ncbi:hypothetical protein DFJ77DRAFT_512699 [Powellomyces hirtus]|nr:hypothetical protein DFJ77DRAFT_512699 [Powellomyces hirtus]
MTSSNQYCVFCSGPCVDYVLDSQGSIRKVHDLASTTDNHQLDGADTRWLRTASILFADGISPKGLFDPSQGSLIIMRKQGTAVDAVNDNGGLPWDVASEDPVPSREYSAEDWPEDAWEWACEGGALAHWVCLNMHKAVMYVRGWTDSRSLWAADGTTLLQPYEAPATEDDANRGRTGQTRKNLRWSEDGVGLLHKVDYGSQGLCGKENYTYDPDRSWMLRRPDRFPPILPLSLPLPSKTKAITTGRVQLPDEVLLLLVDALDSTEDIIAFASTCRHLHQLVVGHFTLWLNRCRRQLYLPLDFVTCDATDSGAAVVDAVDDPSEWNWMAYYMACRRSPSMRNRLRILDCCAQIADLLQFPKTSTTTSLTV